MYEKQITIGGKSGKKMPLRPTSLSVFPFHAVLGPGTEGPEGDPAVFRCENRTDHGGDHPQTGLPFAFSREVVDVNRTISIQLTNAELSSALTQIFAGTRISFRITDRRILLADRETMKQSGSWIVTGKVTDENGAPIVGATVLLQGTTRGTTTNAEGDYRIAILETDTSPTLLFSFIGYDLRNIPVSSTRSIVNVTMKSSSTAIQNVVVTALGPDPRGKIAGLRRLEGQQRIAEHDRFEQLAQLDGRQGRRAQSRRNFSPVRAVRSASRCAAKARCRTIRTRRSSWSTASPSTAR